MIGQLLLVGINQAVHHEDTVIDTDTEDKGRDDDADEVETDIKQHHGTEHDQPTQQDGHETEQGVLQVEVEAHEQHDKHEQHRDPLQHVEVLTHLVQGVGGIIIGVEHEQVWILRDGVTDLDIVTLTAAHGVVGTAHGGETEIVAAIALFHHRRLVAGRYQSCPIQRVGLIVSLCCLEEGIEGCGVQSCLGRGLCNQLSHSR